ncbi:Transporter of the ATP-binding cassette (ABC), partial [Linderina macrospora]
MDLKPIRRPPGNVRLVDNRTAAGAAIALLSILLTVLAFGWQTSATTAAEHLYSASLALAMLLIAAASLYYYAAFMRVADRTMYKGLFPPYLAVAIGTLLAVNLVEVYFSFFTLANSKTPFWFGASNRSRYLLLATAANITLLFLHGVVQRRAIFVRLHSPFLDESDECAPIEPDSGLVQTPLAQKRKQEATPALFDTPEFSGSWLDTLTFSWVNDIFYKGSRRQLGYADLYKLDASDTVIPNWRRYAKYRKPGRSLLVTLGLTFAPTLLAQFLLSLVIAVLHYSGPFFLQRILQSVDALGSTADNSAPTKTIRSAYLDAFGLLFFTILSSQIVDQVMWIGRHLDIRMKGLLVAELSTKTLDRRAKGSLKSATGDDKGDGGDDGDDGDDESGPAHTMTNGKVLNILTTDLNRLAKVCAFLDDLYVMPLLAVIGFIYMFQLLGWSSLIGFSVVIPYYPISKKFFSYLTSLEERTSELSDERVEAITELLQGIKAVKLYGWESQFLKKIDEHRERQLGSMW